MRLAGQAAGKPGEPVGDELADLVARELELLGEDARREGLAETPARVARALRFLTNGYGRTAAEVVADAFFEQDYDEMVLVRDIPFYSLCEHHLLPFFGRCHVAYMPAGRVVGLSKVPRIVDLFAHRLQIQERLTREIAEALRTVLHPQGVAVVIESRHLCMEMRGVEKPESQAVTSCMLGVFRKDARTRMEFLELLRRQPG